MRTQRGMMQKIRYLDNWSTNSHGQVGGQDPEVIEVASPPLGAGRSPDSGTSQRPRSPGLVSLVQPRRKPSATPAGTAEPATYMWFFPGKMTARAFGMPAAVRRNRSSE